MNEERIFAGIVTNCQDCPGYECCGIGKFNTCPMPTLRKFNAIMDVNEFFFKELNFMMELLKKYKRNTHNRIIGEVMLRMLEFAVEIGPDATGR